MQNWLLIYSGIMMVFLFMCGCVSPAPGGQPQLFAPSVTPPLPQEQVSAEGSFILRIDSMKAGDQLPNIYTCKGASESPEISWDNIPQGTKSLALILDDPDAPAGTFTHWILYNIPSEVHSISAGQTFQNVLSNGAQQGENSAGTLGYFSPCPPIGPAHRYIFTLYALDNRISMPAADRNGIEEAMKGRVIGSAKFITMFAR